MDVLEESVAQISKEAVIFRSENNRIGTLAAKIHQESMNFQALFEAEKKRSSNFEHQLSQLTKRMSNSENMIERLLKAQTVEQNHAVKHSNEFSSFFWVVLVSLYSSLHV